MSCWAAGLLLVSVAAGGGCVGGFEGDVGMVGAALARATWRSQSPGARVCNQKEIKA